LSYENLKIIPLGGLGEVGMNCLIYEWNNESIMVDCGIMFPDEESGVEIIRPSFEYVLSNQQKLRALILTHGHEDHIGAVPFLLKYFDVPVFCSRFVSGLITSKNKEVSPYIQFNPVIVKDGSKINIGNIEIEFVGVNHSIPESMSLYIKTPGGNIFHSSDFKFGSLSDRDYFLEEKFSRIGLSGVDLMLGDSTNIEREGWTNSESSVENTIRAIIENTSSRVFITFFPSNIYRMNAFLEIAKSLKKKVVLLGRSMKRYYKIALATGLIFDDNFPIIIPSAKNLTNDSNIIFLISGTQGEKRSATSKISRGEHNTIRIKKGDTFIFSSRHIPGNEIRISKVMDGIAKQGGIVYHTGNTPDVHVSGHGHRKELETMLKLISPSFFIPIHGTYHYMSQHAKMAYSLGIKDVVVLENGEVVSFNKNSGLKKESGVPAGKVMMDGDVEVGTEVIEARRAISEGGVIVAVLWINNAIQEIEEEKIKVSCHGINRNKTGIEGEITALIQKWLRTAQKTDKLSEGEIKKKLRRRIESYCYKYMEKCPYVIVEVINCEE